MSITADFPDLAHGACQLADGIEKLLPGWNIFVRVDIADFRFLGYRGLLENYVFSPYYDIRRFPSAEEVARFMQAELDVKQWSRGQDEQTKRTTP